MGTNIAAILPDLYLAMLEPELETICAAKNYKIDDHFGIFIGTKQNPLYP